MAELVNYPAFSGVGVQRSDTRFLPRPSELRKRPSPLPPRPNLAATMSTGSNQDTAPFFGFIGAASALVFSCRMHVTVLGSILLRLLPRSAF